MSQHAYTLITVVLLNGCSQAINPETEALYVSTCAPCHASGAADAPVAHDPVDWDYRLRDGLDPLVASAIRGRISMPPRGRCWECTDDQIRALVEFMVAPK